MNTKTLLVAAATLAAGALASQAQVYSQNVVGYYNFVIPAGGYELVGNQLINGSDASATNNSVNTAFTGLFSDPNGNTNTVLYYWNGTGYTIRAFYTVADADNEFGADGGAPGFYDTIGDYFTASLPQGYGAFLYNAAPNSDTVTVVGTVPQGTNIVTLSAGYGIYSLVPPVSTNVESSFNNIPLTSDPNGNTNDTAYFWNGTGFVIRSYYTAADADNEFGADSGNGFYDTIGDFYNSQQSVGQAFFLFRYGGTTLWTNSFTVQ